MPVGQSVANIRLLIVKLALTSANDARRNAARWRQWHDAVEIEIAPFESSSDAKGVGPGAMAASVEQRVVAAFTPRCIGKSPRGFLNFRSSGAPQVHLAAHPRAIRMNYQ